MEPNSALLLLVLAIPCIVVLSMMAGACILAVLVACAVAGQQAELERLREEDDHEE